MKIGEHEALIYLDKDMFEHIRKTLTLIEDTRRILTSEEHTRKAKQALDGWLSGSARRAIHLEFLRNLGLVHHHTEELRELGKDVLVLMNKRAKELEANEILDKLKTCLRTCLAAGGPVGNAELTSLLDTCGLEL